MRHSTAVKIDDGWHYADLGKRGGHPLGYCAEHPPHATEAEARECFGKWQRDHVRQGGKTSWTGCAMPACESPANTSFEVEGDGYMFTVLCEEHASIENAIQTMDLDGPAGDAWHS